MKIAYRSFAVDNSGYGSAARGYVRALDDIGVEVDLLVSKHWKGDPVAMSEDLSYFIQSKLVEESDAPFVIQHITPELIRFHPGKYMIAYSAWETSVAPEHWVMPLRACDEVWVPSDWTYKVYEEGHVFRQEGRVIPHGVDSTFFNPRNTPLDELGQFDGFTFGIMSDWIERKGGDILLEAFLREFSADDSVRLVLKGYIASVPEKSSSYIRSRVGDFRNRISYDYEKQGKPKKTFAPIALATRVWSDTDVARFYCSIDCYAHPSRAEGWGLGFTEAMASGVPVMALRGTGNMHYMNDDNAFLIDADFVTIPEDTRLDYQNRIYFAPQQWMNPKLEEVQKMLRHIVDSPEERQTKAERALQDVREKWTWQQAAQKMVDRLTEIEAQL